LEDLGDLDLKKGKEAKEEKEVLETVSATTTSVVSEGPVDLAPETNLGASVFAEASTTVSGAITPEA
jgi:hypothetical protein